MKKFLIKVGLYSAVLFFGLLCFEFSLYTQENEYSYKKHFIEQHLKDIKVLTLGSSLFEVSVDPSIIGDSVFNGSMSGIGNIYKNSATHQMALRYLPLMSNLKTLIIPFPITDAYAGSGTWKYTLSPAGRSCLCMSVKYLHVLTDPRDILYWPELVNSNMQFMKRFERTDEENRICDARGLLSRNRDLEHRKPDWDYVRSGINSNKTRRDTWSVIQAYYEVAEVCREHGIELIGVATPYYKTKQDQITAQMKSDYHYVISEIKKKYPEVQFYDYTCDKRFTSDDFQDAVHLNNNGARKFSKIMKEEILKR